MSRDDDKDGFTSFLEYALGTLPLLPDAAAAEATL